MTLGERIRDCRKSSGMSQEKLAELVGVSRQAVTKWESGQAAPNTENLFKLAEIFGTTVDILLPVESSASCSPAEQIYYLYKLEEAKKVEALRAARKRNLRIALYTACLYLGIFLICRIFCDSIGQKSFLGWLFGTDQTSTAYLFGWLISSKMYLIASVISIIPALFQKYRFSLCTSVGFLIGLIMGELLGPNPAGASLGHSHYGWLIWGILFLISIVSGIVWEKISKYRKNGHKKEGK